MTGIETPPAVRPLAYWFEAAPNAGPSSGVLIVGIDGTEDDDVDRDGEGERRREGGGASSRLRSRFAWATRGVFKANGG